jgi:hypothetical protein
MEAIIMAVSYHEIKKTIRFNFNDSDLYGKNESLIFIL